MVLTWSVSYLQEILDAVIISNGKVPTSSKRLKIISNEVLMEKLDAHIQKLRLIRGNLKGDFEFNEKALIALTTDWVTIKILN